MPWGRVSCISKTACFLVNCASLFPPVWTERGAKTTRSCLVCRSSIIELHLQHWTGPNLVRKSLSQSEAFPPLSPLHSDVDGERDVTLHIKVSASVCSGHLVTRRSPRHFVTLCSEAGAVGQLLFQAVVTRKQASSGACVHFKGKGLFVLFDSPAQAVIARVPHHLSVEEFG